MRGPSRMWVATTVAPAAAATGRYSGSAKPLMSLPTTAPARVGLPATEARQVSTDSGMSKRAGRASMAGITRSSSSSSPTAGPGPAFTPPTSRRSAPSSTSRLGPAEELVEGEGGPLVVEGVGGPVEDAHHQGPVGDVEGPVAEGQDGGVHAR